MKKSKVDRVNKILSELEEYGYKTNTIESAKNVIEIINKKYLHKKGNQERMSKSKNALINEGLENLADEIIEEYSRIKKALSSDDFKKQDDLKEQDYLDLLDMEDEYVTHAMQKHGLSSEQVGDIFKMVKEKNLSRKEYHKIIQNEITKSIAEGFQKAGYRTVINPDKLSKHIRQRIYKYKARRK